VSKRLLTAALVTAALALSGCSTGQEDAVAAAARDFHRALQDHDGAAACSLLAPRTREEVEKSAQKDCAAAILEESVAAPDPHRTVEAFGTMAQVRAGTETTFLSRFPSGWKVMAAGCAKRADDTYDCQVQGG
jgi:hypothetical protein